MPPQEAYAEAAADLAAEAAGKKSKRQRKGGAAAAGGEAGDEEDAFFASLASQDRLPKFVELLKFRVGAWQTSCSFKTVVSLKCLRWMLCAAYIQPCAIACCSGVPQVKFTLARPARCLEPRPPAPMLAAYAGPHPTQTLSPGCKLWGAVIEVTPRELVVSLPHGLRGHVAYSEASDWLAEQAKKAEKADRAAAGEEGAGGRKRKAAAGGAAALPPLTDLFSIGQLVRCTVTGLRDGSQESGDAAGAKKKKGKKGEGEKKQRKRVDVSLRLSKLCAGLGEPRLPAGAVGAGPGLGLLGTHSAGDGLPAVSARTVLYCCSRPVAQLARSGSLAAAGMCLEQPPLLPCAALRTCSALALLPARIPRRPRGCGGGAGAAGQRAQRGGPRLPAVLWHQGKGGRAGGQAG